MKSTNVKTVKTGQINITKTTRTNGWFSLWQKGADMKERPYGPNLRMAEVEAKIRYAYCRNLLRLLSEMELLTAAEHDRILLSCAARFGVRAYV